MPPSLSLHGTVQSDSAQQAHRLYQHISALCTYAESCIGSKDLLKRLMPELKQTHIELNVDQKMVTELITEMITPAIHLQHRRTCGINLSGLGKALLIYQLHHESQFPERLDKFAIVDMEHRMMEKIGIVCPSTKKAYVYRAASLTVSDILTLILAHDEKSNHTADNGRNVLFLDGHVEWVSEERFQELIKKDNEYRKEKGLSVLPAQ